MLIIFLFLRDLRATFIVFMSIPISVIGTFALLYFNGYTLNTMTFGGLALGIGMIVDASIVVLENTFRHMEHGKDRMQASIDGSEEVWSAILASTLTHIAVFVPLLFLTGVSSILFKQLAVVVMFSLTMSLFVAVTIVPVLCSRLLKLPPPVEQRRGVTGRLYTWSENFLNGMDNAYGRLIHRALHHRPTILAVGTALTVAAVAILPTIGFELMPQADEGEVTVSAELPVGSRIERNEDVARAARVVRQGVRAGADRRLDPGGRRRRIRRRRRRWRRRQPHPDDDPAGAEGRAEALQRADRPRPEPSAGERHSRRDHHDPRLGRQPAGEPPARQRRLAHRARDPRRRSADRAAHGARSEERDGQGSGGPQRPRRPRRRPPGAGRAGRPPEGGAVRPVGDRRRELDPHQRRRHAGGAVPRRRQRVSDRRAAARGGSRARRGPQRRADQHAGRPGAAGEEPDDA